MVGALIVGVPVVNPPPLSPEEGGDLRAVLSAWDQAMLNPPPGPRERFDGFNHGYRMRCGCGGVVELTAETYFREQSIEALVPCEHCGSEVHFGPAVAAIRDENDPALGNEAVAGYAWYHTSSWADWPSPQHDVEVEASYRQHADRMSGLGITDIDGAIRRAASRALHLGTYEAAIENMLRRMRDQADDASQFYLYRVAVQADPERINQGYRDENAEEASQLGLADLDADDLDVVRYLNVHEAVGSLSLAIRSECIVATQRLAIPVEELAGAPSAELKVRLDKLEARRAQLEQDRAGLPKLDRSQMVRMRIGRTSDPDGMAGRVAELDRRGWELWRDLDNALTDGYLGGVSPVVADDMRQAVSAWRRHSADDGITAYRQRFAMLAALLTRSHEIIDLVSGLPWRHLRRA